MLSLALRKNPALKIANKNTCCTRYYGSVPEVFLSVGCLEEAWEMLRGCFGKGRRASGDRDLTYSENRPLKASCKGTNANQSSNITYRHMVRKEKQMSASRQIIILITCGPLSRKLSFFVKFIKLVNRSKLFSWHLKCHNLLTQYLSFITFPSSFCTVLLWP